MTVPERLSFIKLFNLSSQLHLNMIYGSVAKSLVPYMMGIHIGRRPTWLVRSAQAEGVTPPGTPESDRPNKLVVVKRSAGLSSDGLMFAQRLARFVEQKCAEFANAHAELYDGTPTPQPPMPSQINSTAANAQLSSSPPSSGLQGATPNRQRSEGAAASPRRKRPRSVPTVPHRRANHQQASGRNGGRQAVNGCPPPQTSPGTAWIFYWRRSLMRRRQRASCRGRGEPGLSLRGPHLDLTTRNPDGELCRSR